MNIPNRLTLGLWGSFLATLLLLSPLQAVQQDTVEKSFTTNGSGLLTLDLNSSSIEIGTHNRSEITIVITRTLKRGSKSDFEDELEKVDLSFNQSGNDVDATLKYESKNNGIWGLFTGEKKRLSFKTVVVLPRNFNVDAKTSGGSVQLNHLEGEAKLRTSGGSITITDVTGDTVAKTSGGSITAKNCQGDLELRTSGGNIRANHSKGSLLARTSGGGISIGDIRGDADVSTSGGSITLGTVQGNLAASTSGGGIKAKIAGQPSEDCVLKTSGGGIRIEVNPSANLNIDASTSGGGVNTDLTLSNSKKKKSSLNGQLNSGGPTLKARTSGGSIHINSI